MGKFVYLYGLIVSTIILFGSMFVPAPYNYLQILLLVPFVVGMWLHLTNPKKVTEATWSIRVVLVSMLLVGIGTGAFYLSRQEKVVEVASAPTHTSSPRPTPSDGATPTPTSTPDFSGILNSIDEENTPIPMVSLGNVKVVGSTEVDVYEEKDADARVVGVALSTHTYPFFESDNNWYLIDIGGTTGWIEAAAVSETTANENN